VVSLQFAKVPAPPNYDKVLSALRVSQAQEAEAAREAAQALAAKKLADEAAARLAAAQAVAQQAVVVRVVAVPVSDNWYKQWIYNEESGNNPTRTNAEGCLGLGQACPASKLLAVCPNEDYACEDAWFTNYMTARYGTWENAYAFHLRMNWW
jgi:hypothetical protein